MLILIQWSYLIFLQKHSKDIESLRVCQNEFQCIEIQFRYKVQHFKTSRYIEIQFQYKVQNFDTLRYIKIHCDTSRNQFDTTLEACQRYRRFRYFSKFISTPVWRYQNFIYKWDFHNFTLRLSLFDFYNTTMKTKFLNYLNKTLNLHLSLNWSFDSIEDRPMYFWF